MIDTHVHVAHEWLLARDVAAIERKMPVLPAEDLLAQMQKHGVECAVLVQWGVSYDHHYVARCIQDFPQKFIGVCSLDYEREEACEVLENLITKYDFRGIRIDTG